MTQTDRAIERLARLSYGRLVARLVTRIGSLADTEARRPARTEAATGALIPLEEQDMALLSDAEKALRNAARHASLGR